MTNFEAPPPGYDVLWFVGVGTAIAPVASREASRFMTSIVVTDAVNNYPTLHRGCWPTMNMVHQG